MNTDAFNRGHLIWHIKEAERQGFMHFAAALREIYRRLYS